MRININKIKKTRKGDLLLELHKDAEQRSAEKLSSAIIGKLNTAVAEVVPLGLTSDIEIIDIDAAANEMEVLEAIRAAITGGDDDAATQREREAVQVTGLWTTKSGHQIATAKVSRETATKLEKVAIGWTMCRVRPRRLPPPAVTDATASAIREPTARVRTSPEHAADASRRVTWRRRAPRATTSVSLANGQASRRPSIGQALARAENDAPH